MRDEKLIIRCPYCEAEYIPSELFYPDDFLPKVFDIVKDEDGHIISYTGDVMNLEVEYCCDKCNHAFKTIASVSFDTKKCEVHDFDFEYSAPLFDRERTELKED